jgi:hypothetical protein
MQLKKKQQTIRDDSDLSAEISKVSLGTQKNGPEYQNGKTMALLSKLLNCLTIEEVRKTMRLFSGSIERSGNKKDTPKKQFIQSIVESNGTVAIVVALEKWHNQSEEFSLLAIGVLVNIVFHDPESNSIIAGIGGIQTIFRVVKKYSESRLVTSDAVELFCSLAGHDGTRREVATEECIDFVIHSMRKFPLDEDIQLEGCEYFIEIGKIEGIKDRLREKKIGAVLGNALDNFRDDFSQQAMKSYAD